MSGEAAATTLLDGDAPAAAAASVADKGAADAAAKAAAEKAGTGFQPTPDEKAASDKAAADKATADKAIADKAAADAKMAREAELAKMSPEERTKAEAADKAAADAKAKAAAGAPEKYEPFKMPEGVKLDDALTTELQSVAKELNLPQAAAQKVADLGAKLAVKIQNDLQAGIAKVRTDWAAMSQSDKEFGGDKLQENLGVAKRGRDALASPEFRKFLNESGLGNHPEMIRVFFRAGSMLAEDKLVTGGKAAGGEKSMAERLYGATAK